MAKFFPGSGNIYFLEDIIVSANQSIFFVSPCLKLGDPLVQQLKDADNKGKKITIIFEKHELSNFQLEIFRNLTNAEFYSCQNLTKEYFGNENKLVVSSKNSQENASWNNSGMRVLIEREEDKELFQNTTKEMESVKGSSKKEIGINLIQPVETRHALSLPVGWGKQTLTEDNLHLPLIKSYIWKNYPDVEYFECINGTIELHNFPRETLSIWIHRRIDVNFEFENEYSRVELVREDFEKRLPEKTKVEWNNKKISIYKPDDFPIELTKESQLQLTEFYFGIIKELVAYF